MATSQLLEPLTYFSLENSSFSEATYDDDDGDDDERCERNGAAEATYGTVPCNGRRAKRGQLDYTICTTLQLQTSNLGGMG